MGNAASMGVSTRYIHNWSLQPFSQDYGLASHITYVVALILYMRGGTYSLKSTSNDQFLRNFSWQFSLLRVFARNLLKGSSRRNIFTFSF